MAFPAIRCWAEPIDGEHIAVLATCLRVRMRQRWVPQPKGPAKLMKRPYLYGWTAFTIVDAYTTPYGPSNRFIHHVGEAMIYALAEKAGNQMPALGLCQDMPGWSAYAD